MDPERPSPHFELGFRPFRPQLDLEKEGTNRRTRNPALGLFKRDAEGNDGRVRTADFDYSLPESLIAQVPLERRDDSRLLILNRSKPGFDHRHFRELPDLLPCPALLVFNDSKVIRARLRAQNARSSGMFELLLLEQNECNDWWAMVRPGKRPGPAAASSSVIQCAETRRSWRR